MLAYCWCEVRSLVSQQLGALVHAWCTGKQLDRCIAATV